MRHRWQYVLLRVVGAIAGRVPRRLLWWCSGVASLLIVALNLRRVSIAIENIGLAFPDRPLSFAKRTARESVRHLIQTALEIPKLARLSREQIVRSVRISNPELALALLQRYHRLIVLSAHYGNWELTALSGAIQLDAPFTIVGKPQRNAWVDRYVNRMRQRFGNCIIPMEGAVRGLIRALQQNSSIAMLADQSGDPGDLFVPFFGRQAATTSTAAALSLKMDVPILMALAVRQPDLSHHMEFVEVDRTGLSGYSESNVLELTRRHVYILEMLIRRDPAQWLWVHRRWKHHERLPHAQAS